MKYFVFSAKKVLILSLAVALLLYTKYQIPNTAYAQGTSLGVYPPILQIDAKPPASVVSNVNIENTQEETVSLEIKFRQFLPSPNENGDIEFIDKPLPPIFQKMQILDGGHAITQLTLAPKQKKSLQLHIGIPENEKASDYYFSIVFISKTDNLVESTQSQTIAGVATNVLLTIEPIGPTKGRIAEFSSPFFVNKGPVPFKIRLENTSNHFVTPKGIVTIKSMFGQTVGKIDLLPVNILSNSTRILPAAKENDVNNPKASWREKFLLGFYTAKVTVGLSDEGPIYNKTTHFIAFPIELLAGFLVSLSIVIVIVKKVREKQLKQG